jgi:hypothetical protein
MADEDKASTKQVHESNSTVDDTYRLISENLAKEIIRIERRCFYGNEPEHGRLKSIREIINKNI